MGKIVDVSMGVQDLNVGHEPFVGSDTFEHVSLMEEREYYPAVVTWYAP